MLAAILFCSAALSASSAADTSSPILDPRGYACPHSALTVFAVDPELAAHICAIDAATDLDLSSCGLPEYGPLDLYVVRRIEGAPGHCLGVYVCETNEIAVVNPAVLAQDDARTTVYGSLNANMLFDSMVVHEIAHARLANALRDKEISVASHEYIAYAMQIASLPAQEREVLLKGAPKGDFDVSAINELTLSFDPKLFFGLVWRHFEAPENGCNFIKSLIDGSVTLGLPLKK